jgi:hypothetical protein
MRYFNRQNVLDAIADLEANKKLPLKEARQNGWKVEVESKYGLTTWVKDFDRFGFTLSEDRGGQRGLWRNGQLRCNFTVLEHLEKEEWIETRTAFVQQLAVARGKNQISFWWVLLKPAI